MSSNQWKQYFLFTQKERKGLVVIGCILLVSFSLSLLFPSATKKQFPNKSLQAVRLFNFDPNTIDSQQALLLGIAPLQIKYLMNYRNKKGRFIKKEDFQKLWGLPIEKYQQLLPFIQIDTQKFTHIKRYPSFWTLDINQASQKEWLDKSGISARELKLIFNYKHYLGVFTSIQQMNNVYGLSDSVLYRIKPHLRLTHVYLPQKPTANSMSFLAWQQLGLFTDPQIIQILRFRKSNRGVISWVQLVGLCDMTQEEAAQLRTKVSFDN